MKTTTKGNDVFWPTCFKNSNMGIKVNFYCIFTYVSVCWHMFDMDCKNKCRNCKYLQFYFVEYLKTKKITNKIFQKKCQTTKNIWIQSVIDECKHLFSFENLKIRWKAKKDLFCYFLLLRSLTLFENLKYVNKK